MKNKVIPNSILLIDGDCMLCNGFLQMVLRNDKEQKISFAALQSETGQELLEQHKLLHIHLETVVFIHHQKAYIRSKAVLKILAQLKWWGKILYFMGNIIPTPLADKLYKWVASNRYNWFGKTDVCLMPTRALKEKILT